MPCTVVSTQQATRTWLRQLQVFFLPGALVAVVSPSSDRHALLAFQDSPSDLRLMFIFIF